MKLFIILRVDDVSGSSGTGRIAEGMVSSDGQVVIFFADSIKIFPSVEKMMEIHSHGGRTRVHFVPSLPKAKPLEREWFPCPPPKKAGMYLLRKTPTDKPVVVQIRATYDDGVVGYMSGLWDTASDPEEGYDAETFEDAVGEGLGDLTTWVVDFGGDTDYLTVEDISNGEWTPLRL